MDDFSNGYNIGGIPYQNGYSGGMDTNDMYKDFNPVSQYEQAYTYYKYLCMQMDYKIKCKEYEHLCNDNNSRSSSSPQNKS